ncbi:DUF2384 domain-containing protein [Cryomorpha ignava]|uniref:DUF2384 domain-containing protein n=1 Tax=Cryomorpha ignava TaxID=101383 RepID=A0A7K3WPW2_9FLAO|nr:DUF2384 domain-containing protein [Cryomorpha ignava]
MIAQNKRRNTDRYNHLIKLLGKKYIKTDIENPLDFISVASRGVEAGIIINFRNAFNIPRDFAAEMLNISEPTLYRWIKEDKKLQRNYAIQLFELTDLFLFGNEVIGSQKNFFKWMELPNLSLGGLEPKELLNIPCGIDKVRNLLGRVDHGVYS